MSCHIKDVALSSDSVIGVAIVSVRTDSLFSPSTSLHPSHVLPSSSSPFCPIPSLPPPPNTIKSPISQLFYSDPQPPRRPPLEDPCTLSRALREVGITALSGLSRCGILRIEQRAQQLPWRPSRVRTIDKLIFLTCTASP
ncbi:hypothetical protein BU26DRAFT_283786 [Trematosphaeria pertusa]|uniref:Uncharacterized protein n=1 Tax=Trematosphaeria pertusa TaxID=390896 RepID=A0A6A6IPF7_9PLEO|nr:uncharacterized protein BU26DRAFT_283786 [Trematosphaeria pertusa]KAF2251470.1 hypothetical protein BU26DRAFT_283786 [Trematosphaeria pertusa]